MKHWTFPPADFLESEEAFAASQRFWEKLVEEVSIELGQAGEWQPWISPFYADGVTLIDRDLRPIWSGRSRRLNRAFRILQSPGGDDDARVGARLKEYTEEWDINLPIAELEIRLVLTERSAAIARRLLRHWMSPDTTIENMRTFMDGPTA